MTDKITLEAQKRTVEGKKTKQLRNKGILPANIFGKGLKSVSVQVSLLDFSKVYKTAGETKIIELKTGEDTHNVLIHNLQTHPVTEAALHVDFQAVSLREKITATVPVEIVGESPAEKEKIGILVQQLSEVDVEALPMDLPERLEADVSGLAEVDAALYVRDLKYDTSKLTIAPEDLEKIVAKIEPPAKEEVSTPPPTAEGEAAVTEGEAPATETEEKVTQPDEEKKE